MYREIYKSKSQMAKATIMVDKKDVILQVTGPYVYDICMPKSLEQAQDMLKKYASDWVLHSSFVVPPKYAGYDGPNKLCRPAPEPSNLAWALALISAHWKILLGACALAWLLL